MLAILLIYAIYANWPVLAYRKRHRGKKLEVTHKIGTSRKW